MNLPSKEEIQARASDYTYIRNLFGNEDWNPNDELTVHGEAPTRLYHDISDCIHKLDSRTLSKDYIKWIFETLIDDDDAQQEWLNRTDDITPSTDITPAEKWWKDDPTVEYNEACKPGDCYWVCWLLLDNMFQPHICDNHSEDVHEECKEYCQYETIFGPYSLKAAQDSFEPIDSDYNQITIMKLDENGDSINEDE